MGSDSDWPVMEPAALALEEFDVPYEAHVLSAHRTPRRMLDYAEAAAGRGLRVIIAGAGGAAHLPGMVAAATPLPVIGVPRAAGPARRPGQPAVDRADAGRGAGGDRRHRRRPQRRAARRPDPGRLRRRACARRWPGSRPTWPTRWSPATPRSRSASPADESAPCRAYDLPVGNNAGLYALTEEHEAIREAVRDIAEREIAPFAAEVDAELALSRSRRRRR